MKRKSKWTVTVPGNSEPQFHFYESLRVEVAGRTASYICGVHPVYQLFTEIKYVLLQAFSDQVIATSQQCLLINI